MARRPGGQQKIPSPWGRRDAGAPVWSVESADFSLPSVLARVRSYQTVLAELPTPRTDERVSAVMVLLADGPGKSTFARTLGTLLDIPVTHLTSHSRYS